MRALARDPPQHRIGEAGVARGAAIGLDQAHREVDRGVVRHLEPHDLRGAQQQCGLEARRVGRQAAVEEMAQQVSQRAEPAYDCRRQRPHQRAVAIGQGREIGMRRLVLELLVERPLAPQHAVQHVGGDAAGGKSRRVGDGRGASHGRHLT